MSCKNFDVLNYKCYNCDGKGEYHAITGYCRCDKYKEKGEENMNENRIAKFEKVSYEQFAKDLEKTNPLVNSISSAYDGYVTIPKRSSKGSAGYDFVSPIGFNLEHGESMIIPTGIRCKMNEDWVLSIYPRSGLGFKTHVRLANTTGIIDSDYFFSDNEGHIMIKLVAGKPIRVEPGDRIAQGIFTQYGITEDDDVTETRNGGLGSSGK